jgi:hypothetical protein
VQERVPSEDVLRVAAETLAAAGAAKGGHARAARLTPEERQEIARNAGRARWATHSLLHTPSDRVAARQPSRGHVPSPGEIEAAARVLAAAGAAKGGHARAARLTPERRHQIAREAGIVGAKTRWGNRSDRETPAGPAAPEIPLMDHQLEEPSQPGVPSHPHSAEEAVREPSSDTSSISIASIGEDGQCHPKLSVSTWRRLLPVLRGLRDQSGCLGSGPERPTSDTLTPHDPSADPPQNS